MNLWSRLDRTHLAAAVGVLLAVGCGVLLHELPIGRGLVQWSYDLLEVWRGERRPEGAVMVYLDEISHKNLVQPYDCAWDRALHAELLEFLGVSGRAGPQSPDDLYAVAYRTTEVAKTVRLEVWAEKLALGAPLPTLPVWLLNALPLDLEQSYRAACDGLRIHLPK